MLLLVAKYIDYIIYALILLYLPVFHETPECIVHPVFECRRQAKPNMPIGPECHDGSFQFVSGSGGFHDTINQ